MKINKKNLSVVTMPYWHYTMEFGMESIQSCGFQNIEFWAASPHYCYKDFVTPEARRARRREIKSLLNRYELEMPVFYPEQLDRYAFINIASPNNELKESSMQIMRDYMDDAIEFGAKAMILSSGWQPVDSPNEKNYNQSVINVKELAENAQNKGLTLLIEPGNRITGTFIWNLETLRDFIKDVDMPNVKACLNNVILENEGDTLKNCLDELSEKVGHVHFADAGGKALGDGHFDIESQLQLLEISNYNGNISLNITFRDCCVNPDRPVFKSAKWLEKHDFLKIP